MLIAEKGCLQKKPTSKEESCLIMLREIVEEGKADEEFVKKVEKTMSLVRREGDGEAEEKKVVGVEHTCGKDSI